MTIHIMHYISRHTRNQRMKFGQLIEYNMKNIFTEKSIIKYVEKTSPRPFLKNQIFKHVSGSTV